MKWYLIMFETSIRFVLI
ncbi:hypothetical protein F383_33068 [Gossypium arboreum]|uniref:Uncharacterized protein n=1 Tax=Gossypium arboreum TaxID=29729 RepID=A0A0B0N4W0_GOSAR|nr:hypothetical protein F383_33068 [Gossypium arboreum]